MHSLADMNMATYGLIGKAYSLIEEKDPWLDGAQNVADIAVLSVESLTGERTPQADVGANRMLLENKCLYNFIDGTMDFSEYKLLVLPDAPINDDAILDKIKEYVDNGGKVIASGEALVKDGRFVVDTGADYKGKNEYNPSYIVPYYETVNGENAAIMRCDSYIVDVTDGEIVAGLQNPYFHRTLEHFCSHMHAPNNPDVTLPGAVIKGNVAYIGWDIFTAYAKLGHLCFKEVFTHLLKTMLGDEMTVSVAMPDRAVMTYTRQAKEKRNILHLLYAHTTVRGQKTEVIEDTVPLYNVKCAVKKESMPSKVYLAPSGERLDYNYSDGVVEFTVPKVDIHQLVVIDD
jgi:hypothetical protein